MNEDESIDEEYLMSTSQLDYQATAEKTIPELRGHWLLGHLQDFQTDTLALLKRLSALPDPVTKVRFGPRTVYVLSDLDAIHEKLVKRAKVIVRGGKSNVIMTRTMGKGILTADGDSWFRNRRMVQPMFHATRIGNYADIMVEHAVEAIHDLTQGDDGTVHDMHQRLNQLTLGVVTASVFSNSAAEHADFVGETIDRLQHNAIAEIRSFVSLPEWVRTPRRTELAQYSAQLRAIVMGVIRKRRQEGVQHHDLLDMLIAARDEDTGEGMSDEQICDEVITIYLAGYDTTALTLTWTFYLLAQHPEVLEKLRAELNTVLDNGRRLPTLADLPQLTYAEMVIKETMRVRPPAYINTRKAIEDVEIAGYTIPAGSMVLSSIYGIHHRDDLWGDPDTYRPERFADNAEAEWHKVQYMPFSTGPHVCIGNRFAMMEAVLVLATLVSRMTFALADPDFVLEPIPLITLNCGELPMRLRRVQ